ncbi:MAG TPA: PAS domain S-box protein, partial [Caulobacteraceae bacterium]
AADESTLVHMAQIASLAVENGRLLEQVRAARDQLDAAKSEADRILGTIADAFYSLDREWRFVYCNPAAEQMFGRSHEELVGNVLWDCFPEISGSELWLRLEEAAAAREPSEFVVFHPERNAWYSDRVFPTPNGISVTIRDVTEQVMRERELGRLDAAARAATDRIRRLTEISTDLICTVDPDGAFVDMSPGCEAVLGYRPDELVGRPVADFIVTEEVEASGSKLQALVEGEPSGQYLRRHRHKDGSIVHLQWAGRFSPEDGLLYLIGRDVSERIELEERLQHSQRLEAMGQLTGGIAHDFNNLLTVILGNAEILEEGLQGQPLGELAALTRSAAERGADLTSRLLSFARRQTLRTEAVEIDDLLASMRTLLERTLGEHVEIEFRPGAAAGPVAADSVQLEAAVLNLAINAREAMGHGGRLVIETAVVAPGDCPAAKAAGADAYVMLAVRDSGAGMPPEVAARAFEPFFTTKQAGKGSGLGLSMVYGFAKQSGGSAEIESEPGAGTTVRLFLPLWRGEQAEQAEPTPVHVAAGSSSSRVLLVEDDELVRAYARMVLEELGFETVEARTGAEAVAALVSGQPFDLVFSDVVMPGGMSGRDLAMEAGRLRPDLPVLLTSGYEQEFGRSSEGPPLLRKPYRPSQLAEAVRSVMCRAAA